MLWYCRYVYSSKVNLLVKKNVIELLSFESASAQSRQYQHTQRPSPHQLWCFILIAYFFKML